MRDELDALRKTNASLHQSAREQQEKYAGLCRRFDEAQAAKLDLEVRWDRLREDAAAHVRQVQEAHPGVVVAVAVGPRTAATDQRADDGGSVGEIRRSASAQGAAQPRAHHQVLEDLLHLKQAVNDAATKLFGISDQADERGGAGGGGEEEERSGNGSGNENENEIKNGARRKVALTLLSLHDAPTRAFVRLLQRLVEEANARNLQRDPAAEALLQAKLDRWQARLAASDKARSAAEVGEY